MGIFLVRGQKLPQGDVKSQAPLPWLISWRISFISLNFFFHFFSLDGPIINNFDLVEIIYICVCKHVWHKVTFLYLQQTSYSLQLKMHFLPVLNLFHIIHILIFYFCLLVWFVVVFCRSTDCFNNLSFSNGKLWEILYQCSEIILSESIIGTVPSCGKYKFLIF